MRDSWLVPANFVFWIALIAFGFWLGRVTG